MLNTTIRRSDLGGNLLLSALPEETIDRWLPHLEWSDLPTGRVLHEPHRPQTHVYFPTTATVSFVYLLENGASIEVAMVGKEGVTGLGIFMGRGSTPSRAVVQSAGRSLRLSSSFLRSEFLDGGPALLGLLRYTAALFVQVCQTSVCNHHHSLDERLCRWLLLSLDRAPDNHLEVTQGLIASLLGVRRAGVNASAAKLQEDGVLRYTRGRIVVLDREALESRSCECYRVVREEYRRLLPVEPGGRVIRQDVAGVI